MKLPDMLANEDLPVRVSLVLLAALLTVPYLYPFHYEPVGSFHAEWLAALFGLLAGIGLVSPRLWRTSPVPGVALLFVALIALALLQLVLGVVNLLQQTQMFILYLGWALVLTVLGAGLRRRLGLVALADWLATAILLGALLGAAAGLAANAGLFEGMAILFPTLGMKAIHGNIAQPNHLANHLWMGLASALYLAMRGQLHGWLAGIGLAMLMWVAILTGSRTNLLYLTAFVGIALLARWRRPTPTTRRALRLVLALIPLFAACQVLGWAADRYGWMATMTPVDRVAADSGHSIRLQLLTISWQAFLQAPLLGHGIGSFAPLSIELADRLPFGTAPGGIENAHDLPANLLAEMGFAAPLLLLVLLALWLRGALRSHGGGDDRDTAALGWMFAVLAVEGVHSLVEYPLHYTFFLGPTALLLGAVDTRTLGPALFRLRRPLVVSAMLAGLFVLYALRIDYLLLETTVNPWLTGGPRRASTWPDMVRIESPLRHSLVYPNFCPVATARLTMPPEPLQAALDTTDCAMRVLPLQRIAYRRALVLVFAGRADEGERAWRQALVAYPRQAPQAVAELKAMLKRYPNLPLGPLLAAAEETARRLPVG